MDVSKELEAAARTSRERHAVYAGAERDSLVLHSQLMELLFPKLLVTGDGHDARRTTTINFITAKLARYAISLDNRAPHLDSLHDLGIYSIMLERIEMEIATERKEKK